MDFEDDDLYDFTWMECRSTGDIDHFAIPKSRTSNVSKAIVPSGKHTQSY